MKIERIGVLGAGTIGASWTAMFLAAGRSVAVFEPSEEARSRIEPIIASATEALRALGWSEAGDLSKLSIVQDPAEAVSGADFIQENAPEQLEAKHALYQRIESALAPEAILASSTSGLTLSALQAGLANPAPLIIAHPFNPPHLIPLVELVTNDATGADVLARTKAFYESIGKTAIVLKKEAIGHVANRLQAALWREAIHLAAEGVASVEDIDKAVSSGLGLRWAALGPTAIFHLGGGPGGIKQFCAHLGEPVEGWWRDLGAPERLTPELVEMLTAGMAKALEGSSEAALAQRRDSLVLKHLLAQKDLDT